MDRDTVEPTVGDLPGDRARATVGYHHRTAAPSTYVYEILDPLAEFDLVDPLKVAGQDFYTPRRDSVMCHDTRSVSSARETLIL